MRKENQYKTESKYKVLLWVALVEYYVIYIASKLRIQLVNSFKLSLNHMYLTTIFSIDPKKNQYDLPNSIPCKTDTIALDYNNSERI